MPLVVAPEVQDLVESYHVLSHGERRHAGPNEGDGVRETRNVEDKTPDGARTEQRKQGALRSSPVTSFTKSKVKVRTRAEPKRPAGTRTPRETPNPRQEPVKTQSH